MDSQLLLFVLSGYLISIGSAQLSECGGTCFLHSDNGCLNKLSGYPSTNCGGDSGYGCCMDGYSCSLDLGEYGGTLNGRCLNVDVQGGQCTTSDSFLAGVTGLCPGGIDVVCCIQPIAMCAPFQFPTIAYGSYESCGNMPGNGAVCKIVCTTATDSSVSIVLYGHTNIISVC